MKTLKAIEITGIILIVEALVLLAVGAVAAFSDKWVSIVAWTVGGILLAFGLFLFLVIWASKRIPEIDGKGITPGLFG